AATLQVSGDVEAGLFAALEEPFAFEGAADRAQGQVAAGRIPRLQQAVEAAEHLMLAGSRPAQQGRAQIERQVLRLRRAETDPLGGEVPSRDPGDGEVLDPALRPAREPALEGRSLQRLRLVGGLLGV